MTGQKRSGDVYLRDRQVFDYIQENNPYEKKEPLKVDIREYSRYIQENGLKRKDITPELVKKFEYK